MRRCLAKEPEARPAVGELRALFGEFDADGWLPAGLPGLIAAQAARIVALPVPEPTVTGAEPAGPAPAGPSPTRRRLLVTGAALGAGTAAAAAWWLGSRDATGQSGSAVRPRYVVGLLGRSGDGVVTAQERGARLAVEQHNCAAGRAFDLVLRSADDRDTAEGAAAAAAGPAAAPDLAVVIGAGTNATVLAAVEACARARVALLLTRADTHRLDSVTRTTALLLRLTRTAGPPAILRHPNRVVKLGRTVIVHDLSDAAETAASVRIVTVYGKLDGETAVEEVPAGGDFADVVRRIAVRPRDAVMFAGLRSARAAAFARALAGTGHHGARVAGEHVLGARFLAEAEGWMAGTGYADAGADPRLRSFAAAHRDRYGRAPAPWAAEAYDAVRFAAHGLAAPGDDGPAALRSELLRRPWQGITRRIAYHAGGQFYDTDRDGGAFLYRVTDGATRFVARADDIGGEA